MRFWLLLASLIGLALLARLSSVDGSISFASLLPQKAAPLLDARIRYRIGFIDPRFNISKAQVQQLTQQAVNIWHEGAGKEIFVEDEHATLNIQLIFDERQIQNNLRQEAKQQLTQQQAQQADQLNQYRQQQKQLELDLMQIQAQQKALHTQQDQHQTLVDSWHRLGTIDPHTRQQLAQQRQQLDAKQAAIQSAIANYNQEVQLANQQLHQLNHHIDHVNTSIENFNLDFQSWQFEKGIFNGADIIIYAFDSPEDLRLTIAHELGHAMGLKHNDDPKALMYPMLRQHHLEHTHLKPSDIAMLD